MNNNDCVSNTVLRTSDYTKFKALEGNRSVLENRKARIRKSVKENGQLFSPIIVNEKMEIIDGQGRYEVFKEDNLPIDYIIKPGLTLKDCVILNSTSMHWTLQDYIDSFVVQGNANYERLNNLVKMHKNAPIGTIMFASVGIANSAHYGNKNDIKGGKLEISEEKYFSADQLLSYAERFLANFEKGNGNKSYLMNAAMFCYGVENVDPERLVDKWNKYGNIKSIKSSLVSIRDAIHVLEQCYNFKSPINSVIYFETEYDKYCRKQNSSYSTRWLSKKENDK